MTQNEPKLSAIAPQFPRKVAILRALNLGDLLVAIPALRALRFALPNARFYLVGLPWARDFVGRFAHLLDGFREFPGWPGLPERKAQIERIPGFLARMQAEQFDLVLQLHGSGPVVNPLCELFAARRLAGFFLRGDRCPDPQGFLPWPEQGLELRRLLALTEALGCPERGEHLEFPLRDGDFSAAHSLAPYEPGSYVCIHPGASASDRRWPPERFAAVAEALATQGFRVVLTGSFSEASLTRQVAQAMAAPALDLAGKTSLGVVGALIAKARLLVCNDTGVSHIADAVRTASVVISTGDNPQRWSPIDTLRHRVLCELNGVVATRAVLEAAHDLIARTWDVSLPEGIPCAPSAS